jgi:hypothetical protein
MYATVSWSHGPLGDCDGTATVCALAAIMGNSRAATHVSRKDFFGSGASNAMRNYNILDIYLGHRYSNEQLDGEPPSSCT